MPPKTMMKPKVMGPLSITGGVMIDVVDIGRMEISGVDRFSMTNESAKRFGVFSSNIGNPRRSTMRIVN